MDEKILEKMLSVAENFFKTASDSSQIPINKESFYKIQRLHPKTLLYKTKNNKPISWIVILPTSKKLADEFLQGKISERELLDKSNPQKEYEALYLCAAFTIPKYRRKGYVIEMLNEAIGSIPHTDDIKLFAWSYSQEGKSLIKKLEKTLGGKIELKK